MTRALVDELRSLGPEAVERILATCTPRELAALKWCWTEFWARPDEREPGAVEGRGQLPPAGDWTWHAHIGGRGSGKTESCSRWINAEADRLGHGCVVHLLGQTIDDAAETMIEGPSGLLATAPPWARPTFVSGNGKAILRWPSGARGRVFSAEMAKKGRGPQCNRFWIDDPAAFGAHGLEVLEQLLLGFRLNAPDGSPPRGVISSTPIDSAILEWIMRGTEDRRAGIVYSRSATDDNRGNLSRAFFDVTLSGFAGTALERQERHGEYDTASARKVYAGIDFRKPPIALAAPPDALVSVAVWVDPALSTATKACEVGIVAVGKTPDGHAVVLEDASAHLNAYEWPHAALDCLERWRRIAPAGWVGVETNRSEIQPEALVTLTDSTRRQALMLKGLPPTSPVRVVTVHTSKTKAERASMTVELYRTGWVQHVPGLHALEVQLRDLSDSRAQGPGRDRADASVYGVLDVFGILDKVRPGAGPVPQASIPVGAFGARALESVAVGPPAAPPPTPSAGPGVTMRVPGMPVGAFGRSTW